MYGKFRKNMESFRKSIIIFKLIYFIYYNIKKNYLFILKIIL